MAKLVTANKFLRTKAMRSYTVMKGVTTSSAVEGIFMKPSELKGVVAKRVAAKKRTAPKGL